MACKACEERRKKWERMARVAYDRAAQIMKRKKEEKEKGNGFIK